MLYQAPSPQRKKEPPPRENKLRLFLKRSSEPLLNLQNAAQQVKNFSFTLFLIIAMLKTERGKFVQNIKIESEKRSDKQRIFLN